MHVSYKFCLLKLKPDTVTVHEGKRKEKIVQRDLDLLDTMKKSQIRGELKWIFICYLSFGPDSGVPRYLACKKPNMRLKIIDVYMKLAQLI